MIASFFEKKNIYYSFLIVGIVFVFVLVIQVSNVFASDCHIDYFNISTSNVSIGKDIKMEGKGSCSGGVRAVKFTVDGDSKAETSLDHQSEWFRSKEYGTGKHTLCFLVSGGSNGSWDEGVKQCKTVTVSSSGSNTGESGNSDFNGSCEIDYFELSATQVTLGTDIEMKGKGYCPGGVRAVKFTVDGDSKAEISDYRQTEWFRSKEYGVGKHQLCFLVAGGSNASWSAGTKKCKTVTVLDRSSSNQNSNSSESNSGSSSSSNNNQSSNNNEDTTIHRNYLSGWANTPGGNVVYVPSDIDALRFRTGPDTSYSAIGYVKPNDWYKVKKESFLWVKIETYNGTVGWIMKEFVRIDHTQISDSTCKLFVKPVFYNPSGGHILLIKVDRLPDTFTIFFDGEKVKETEDGIQHFGVAEYPDSEYIALGISTRFVLLHLNTWFKPSMWELKYPCNK